MYILALLVLVLIYMNYKKLSTENLTHTGIGF